MTKDFTVSVSPGSAATAIIDGITHVSTLWLDSEPGILLDNYQVDCPLGTTMTLIFTNYYARVGSFVTLVVTIDDLHGQTHVHVSTGGHKKWWDDNDFGASSSFIKKVEAALKEHIL